MPIPKLTPSRLRVAQSRDVCPACFEPWLNHYGVITQCQRLQIAMDCLSTIVALQKGTQERRLAAATLLILNGDPATRTAGHRAPRGQARETAGG